MSSANSDSFTVAFSVRILWIVFCLFSMARISNTMFNKSGKSEYPFLIPDLKCFQYFTKYDDGCMFIIYNPQNAFCFYVYFFLFHWNLKASTAGICIESCQWFPKVFKIWQWVFGMTKGTFSYLGFFFFPPSKFGTFVFWEGPGTSCSTEGWKQWLMRRNGYKRECDSLRLLIPSSRRVFVSRQIK